MATRVSNKFRVTNISLTTDNSKKVTFTPVYQNDPDYSTGTAVYNNAERTFEILVPLNASSYNTFTKDALFYMDFTAVT